MTIAVSIDRIKAKAGITASGFEDQINALISEVVPQLSESIQPTMLSDTSIALTLNLGATEIVTGELLAELSRRPELQLSAEFGDLKVYPRKAEDPSDPSGLIKRGWSRIRPWLRKDPEFQRMGAILSAPNRGVPGEDQ